MEIKIIREAKSSLYVQGSLYVNGIRKGFTLERKEDLKMGVSQPMSCIPCGRYQLALMYSPKFKKRKIHVLRVPHRDKIMIHEGNQVNESRGCVLFGHYRKEGWVLESKLAVLELEAAVHNAEVRGELIYLTIVENVPIELKIMPYMR